jgi:mRNA interferase HigB
MHVISKRALRDFYSIHDRAKGPLLAWHRLLECNDFSDLNDLRGVFPSADYTAPFTVFNIGGNRFRIVTAIHYNRRKVYVRAVLTHAEYDRWSAGHRRRHT